MMAKRRLDRGDVLVGHSNLVGQRSQDGLGLLQRGQCAHAEAFVLRLQLLEQMEAGALFGLLMEKAVQLVPRLGDLLLNLAEPLLSMAGELTNCVSDVVAPPLPPAQALVTQEVQPLASSRFMLLVVVAISFMLSKYTE